VIPEVEQDGHLPPTPPGCAGKQSCVAQQRGLPAARGTDYGEDYGLLTIEEVAKRPPFGAIRRKIAQHTPRDLMGRLKRQAHIDEHLVQPGRERADRAQAFLVDISKIFHNMTAVSASIPGKHSAQRAVDALDKAGPPANDEIFGDATDESCN